MFGLMDITQFRIIQTSLSDLTFVLASHTHNKSVIEQEIRVRAQEIFGADPDHAKNIHFEWCESIAPDPSGKVRMLISKV